MPSTNDCMQYARNKCLKQKQNHHFPVMDNFGKLWNGLLLCVQLSWVQFSWVSKRHFTRNVHRNWILEQTTTTIKGLNYHHFNFVLKQHTEHEHLSNYRRLCFWCQKFFVFLSGKRLFFFLNQIICFIQNHKFHMIEQMVSFVVWQTAKYSISLNFNLLSIKW